MHLRSARVIGLLFAFLSVFLLFRVSAANAQTVSSSTQTYTATPQHSSSVSPDVPRNQHTHVQITLIEIMSALTCQLVGIDPITPSKGCLGIDPTSQKIGYTQQATDGEPKIGGAIGAMSNMIAMTYTPPVSSLEYMRYMASGFGLDKAYAQVEGTGYGFHSLSPFMQVFIIARNLSYFLFALAMVIIGVAIMLRVKIDPRTVMTIQNQIPKIVVGLILITFSYAIVGFLVDMMWVTTYASINVLGEAANEKGALFIDAKTTTANLVDNPIGFTDTVIGLDKIIGQVGGAVGTIITDILNNALNLGKAKAEDCGDIITTFGPCVEEGFYAILLAIFSLVGLFIVTISLFIVLFRIWFMLIKAFAMIVLATIAAPLWIVAGLVPGSKISFGGWLRQIIANLAVFPAAVIMFLLAKILIDSFSTENAFKPERANDVFIPPLVGNVNQAELFGVIIGFGALLMTPDLLNMLRDALKSPPSQYGGNLRSRFMAGNPLGAAAGAGTFGYTMANMRHVPVVGGFFERFGGAESRDTAARKAPDAGHGPGGS